jgi:hypothetical protein
MEGRPIRAILPEAIELACNVGHPDPVIRWFLPSSAETIAVPADGRFDTGR